MRTSKWTKGRQTRQIGKLKSGGRTNSFPSVFTENNDIVQADPRRERQTVETSKLRDKHQAKPPGGANSGMLKR